ncbi:EamA family transporter [Bifidobacterium ruminantium]|uniref:EamA family transporter n=1 Tax=Bifidobacterium ruminantium TaxID=78346 RepID=UPI000AFC4C5E|nr:EamA family transporter [Bifidobacterium ruminantium]
MGAQIMENMSLPHLPGSQTSIIMYTECLFAAVFSAIFAGERFTMNTVIGFALIFTAMVMSAKCSEE